jgi:3'-phosphoadenosine 5'-phosphosulfate (PAPS) 3'-phosphatase
MSIAEVLKIALRACQIVKPLVETFYTAMNDKSSRHKKDKSIFTTTDGTVQKLFLYYLFRGFCSTLGEEKDNVNLTNVLIITKEGIEIEPYSVDGLRIGEEFYRLVDEMVLSFVALRSSLRGVQGGQGGLAGYTIVLDPIDGTREFATKQGEQCTICIGIADHQGVSVGGLVYRPIGNETYAMGDRQGFYEEKLNRVKQPYGLLTTPGHISKFLQAIVETMQQVIPEFALIRAGGSGNKVLKVLEGYGIYVQDRGLSRWDTCGSEAILAARGGLICMLEPLLTPESPEQGYNYLKTGTNLNFKPDVALLSDYNSRVNPHPVEKTWAKLVEEVEPYANLLGLLVIPEALMHLKVDIIQACIRAKEIAEPEYN